MRYPKEESEGHKVMMIRKAIYDKLRNIKLTTEVNSGVILSFADVIENLLDNQKEK